MKSLKSTKESRLNNVVKNAYTALFSQVVILILGFISRGVLINTLGNEYAGINGLFTNILAVISLAELGLGTSMIFSYYKPLADKDYDKLSSLINYYRRIYFIIVCVIMAIGVVLTPFVKWFIKMDVVIEHIELYFLLYVINTATSYMFVYRTDIIAANQKRYVITNINFIARVIRVLLQVVVLLVWKAFMVYLVIEVVMNIVANLVCNEYAKKHYEYCNNKSDNLTATEKKEILDNFKSSAIYKIAVVVINSTDNILISKIVGTISVGLYSNYCMITTALTNILVMINNSIVASVGNLIAEKDIGKKRKVMDGFMIGFIWLAVYVSTMFYLFVDQFVILWIGKENIIYKSIIIIMTISIYVTFSYNGVTIYREAGGIFRKTKYVTVVEAVINIVSSIILGNMYGTAGIIAGTILSKACTRLWFEPYIIYKQILEDKPKKFIIYNILAIILTIIMINLCQIITSMGSVSWISMIIKAIVCTAIINLLIYFIVHPLEEYKYMEGKIKRYIKRKNI